MPDRTPRPLVDERAQVAAEDARVFDALAQAQKQYEEYIRIGETASLADIWADSLVLPPADVPLSLTIWPEK